MSAVKKIILINLVVYGITFLFFLNGLYLNNILALYPIFSDNFSPYQLITHIFSHSTPLHLFSNMILLLIFSTKIEEKLSDKQSWNFYLLSGLLSSGVYCLFSESPIIGASGCVFAFMGFYLINNPISNLRSYSGISKAFASCFIIFSFITELWDSIFTTDDIAHLCHVFGFCFGIFYALRNKSKFVQP